MRLSLFAALLVAAFVPVPVSAIVADGAAAAPTSPSGEEAGRRFLADYNVSDDLTALVAGHFAEASLARESAAERAAMLANIRRMTGGFEILAVTPQGERAAEFTARARQGGRFARIALSLSRREPGKISNLFILADRDPDRAVADRFPETAVAEAQIAPLVRKRLDALAAEDSFSGAVLIAHRDKVLLREARGLADATWGIANKADMRFNIASIGKMWTAVVVLKLAEEGKLSLDDTLARWVPSYPHFEAAAKIRLRDLLNHTAGIAPWDGRRLGDVDARAAAATMAEAPAEPGRFNYSNAGYVLLSAAAEAASGESYDALVDRIIFKPAGMTNSGLWPVTAIIPNRATGYLRPEDDPLGYGPRFANDQFLGYRGNGSGGGYSTIDDMFAFHRAFAADRMISFASRETMLAAPVEFFGTPRPAQYGYGLRLEQCAGAPTLGHSGGGANSGVSSATYASMDGEWTIIVLGNVDPMPEELAIDICRLVHRK